MAKRAMCTTKRMNCAICHGQTLEEHQAFLDTCFHAYCYKCIVSWTAQQREGETGVLLCPLCRVEYRSVFYSCVHGMYRRHWFEDDREDTSFLTAEHVRRRRAYLSEGASEESLIQRPVAAVLKERSVTDDQSQIWIRRELQALLLMEDVHFLAAMIIQMMQDETRSEAGEKLETALEPFLHSYSHQFVTELFSFLASGLNVRGFDAFKAEDSHSTP